MAYGELEAALIAEIESLRAEAERLREALKRISEGDVGRPLKAEKCSHGQYGYEHCEECFSDFARGALEGASDD